MFTQYDVIVLIILLTSATLALFRGIIREIFSFVAWVGAAVITFLFYPVAAEMFKDMLKSSVVVSMMAVVATYFIVFFLLSGMNALILDYTRDVRTGPVDRVLGLLFGLFRGLLIVALIHYCVVQVQGSTPTWLQDSEFFQVSERGSKVVEKAISGYVDGSRERFGLRMPEAKEKLDPSDDNADNPEMPDRLRKIEKQLKKSMDQKFTPDE